MDLKVPMVNDSVGPVKLFEAQGKRFYKFVKLIWIKRVVEIKNLQKTFLIFDVCERFDTRCPLIGELK